MSLYAWIVIAHVFFVIVSFGAHGVSAFAMVQVRKETDRARIAAILDLSGASLYAALIGLLAAVALGIVAAVMGGHFGRLWPWVAIAVVVAVVVLMTNLGTKPMVAVRTAVGLPHPYETDKPPPSPASDAELAAAQAKLRPALVMAAGVGAIAVLVWLMEAKPF